MQHVADSLFVEFNRCIMRAYKIKRFYCNEMNAVSQ